MEVTQDQIDKVHALMERFWKDVASLPWTDPAWVNSGDSLKEPTRQHFVNATANDVIDVMKGVDNATVPSNN